MNSYLLDTSVVIDWLRGRDPVVAWLGDTLRDGARLVVTPITVAEVLAGVPPAQREGVSSLLSAFQWSGMSFEAAVWAGQLYWDHDRAGRRLPLPDVMQAAIALEGNLTVATSNARPFPDASVLDPRLYAAADS